MLNLIGFIIFGFIVGLIARALMPGDQNMGIIATTVLGVIGSFTGGLIAWLFAGRPEDGIHAAGWIMAVICGIALLAIGEMLARRRTV